MDKVKTQIASNTYDISTIDSEDLLLENLLQNDIPLSIQQASFNDYEEFLKERRVLMAKRIKNYYEQL